MKTWIFVVSFLRDVEFLRFALRSINKYATGFDGVQVVVPRRDCDAFEWVANFGARLGCFNEVDGKGFVHHLYQKVCADQWCPEADVIVYFDSDCMFWDDATPADYIIDGKPVLYRERYDLIKNRLRLHWRTATKAATGLDSESETMCKHPIVHLPETCAKTREVIERHTGRGAEDYILACRNEFPQSFCEHVALGTVALKFFAERYHWVDFNITSPDGGFVYERGRDKLIARWSHSGVGPYATENEKILT